MFLKGLFAAILALPAVASAQSFTRALVLNNQGGHCPRSITLGTLGDSFASGVRYTLAIKDLVRAGSVRVQSGPANHADLDMYADSVSYVIFTATLQPQWMSCVSDTYVHGLTMSSNGVVRISLRNGQLRYVFKDEANVIRNPSTYNNQAILFYSELL